jgi:hypothetical protein
MTPDEQQQQRKLERLCLAVIQEKNPGKLTPLVEELNKFLAEKERKSANSALAVPMKTKKSGNANEV